MKCLFIGGNRDGEHIEVNDGDTWFMTLTRKEFKGFDADEKFTEEDQPHRYKRVKFAAGGSWTFIYVGQEIWMGGADEEEIAELTLHALVAGYKAPNKEGEQRLPPPQESRSKSSQSGSDFGTTSRSREQMDADRYAIMMWMKRSRNYARNYDSDTATFMGMDMNKVADAVMMALTSSGDKQDCPCPACRLKRLMANGNATERDFEEFIVRLIRAAKEAEYQQALEMKRAMMTPPTWTMDLGDEAGIYELYEMKAKTAKLFEQERKPKALPKPGFDYKEANKAPTNARSKLRGKWK